MLSTSGDHDRAAIRWRLHAGHVFVAVIFLGLFALAARNVTDPDVWWHLKTGQLIVENKTIPHTDPFSYTRAGQPWITHEWLTEILLYELHRIAGFSGLIIIFALILCAAFLLLYLRCGTNVYVAGIATLFAAFATRPVWGVRPQVISLLLTSLWLLILERSERRPRLPWWTVPLMLLWANLHAGFALGLALSFLFILGAWIEARFGHKQNPRTLRLPIAILALDLLMALLNPNGIHLFWYPLQTLRSAAMQTYIAEWASPNFHRADYWPFLCLILAMFAFLGCSHSKARPRNLLLLAVSLFAGLRSIRMIPLFVLIVVPLIARRVEVLLHISSSADFRERKPTAAANALNAAIIVTMLIFAIVHVNQVIRNQQNAEIQNFPCHAIAFVQSHPPHGPIFNDYDWGGYLVWKLYPSVPVFIDGRADVYGEPLLRQFANTYQFKNGWEQPLKEWNIYTVLVRANSPLAVGLRHNRDWIVSYEDSQAVILSSDAVNPGATKSSLGSP
jgi:hypothetical protein